MAVPSPRAPEGDVPFRVMLRGAMAPTCVVGALGIVGLGATRGWGGAASALVGLVLSVAFFGSGLVLLARFVTERNPMLFVAVGASVYLGQVLLLLGFLLVLQRQDWLDGTAFGVEVLLCLVVWQVFQIRAWRSARIPIYDGPRTTTPGERR